MHQSDVISLSVALAAETRHLINAERLAQMKAGALIINTARGGLVDQVALQAALISGQIGGYASDVLDAEPPPANDPLLANPRCLITPHIAAITDATYRLICVSTVGNVVAFLRGESVEPQAIYKG